MNRMLFLGFQYFEISFYILQYQFKQTEQLSNVTVLLGWLTALFKYFDLNLQIYKFNRPAWLVSGNLKKTWGH